MSKYKHIKFNYNLQGLDWLLEQIEPTSRLIEVVPFDAYHGIGVVLVEEQDNE